MIDLYVFNRDIEILGEISEYINLEFERRIDSYSQLILNIQANKETINLLQVGNIISSQDNPTYGYIIEHFNYTQDNSEQLEIVAFSLNYLLSFRTIYPQQYNYGTHEQIIRNFVSRNTMDSLQPNRVIPRLVLGPLSGVGFTTRSSKTGGNLLEQVLKVANEIGGSVDVLLNFNDKTFELIVWQGTNRSMNQSVNNIVAFSEDFDNVLTQNYFLSMLDYKNAPIVAGEGEGVARQIVDNNTSSGLDRREVFVDARDLQSVYNDDDGNEITLTPQEYTDALISRGNESIIDSKIVSSFETEVENVQFVYGRDYFIGDIVSFKNLTLGITINVPVSVVKTISNSLGTSVLPSLGSGVPNVYKKGGL